MTYWVKRIKLKSGEIVTERELRPDENIFEGPAPVVGDKITVSCRGRQFEARVIWGSWPGRVAGDREAMTIPLRVPRNPDSAIPTAMTSHQYDAYGNATRNSIFGDTALSYSKLAMEKRTPRLPANTVEGNDQSEANRKPLESLRLRPCL